MPQLQKLSLSRKPSGSVAGKRFDDPILSRHPRRVKESF
jgi:hypothetical protein